MGTLILSLTLAGYTYWTASHYGIALTLAVMIAVGLGLKR